MVPGWFTVPGAGPELLVRAVHGWDPQAVVMGRAAARLTFWPDLPVDRVEIATSHRLRPNRHLVLSQRRIPAACRMGGFTTPAATAVDLAAHDHGAAITEALRRGAARPEDIAEALTLMPGRRGNRRRRELVMSAARNPWSVAEHRLHETLCRADLPFWEGNARIRLGRQTVFGDVVFREYRLVVEVDGWSVHGHPTAFREDRRRQNLLVQHGWRVLRFTWQDLDDPDYILRTIRSVLVLTA